MTTRLVGYQPQYFPRLHYFARILDSDIFTISDYLQYVRHHVYEHGGTKVRGPSYQAHTPIKNGNGLHLLDVPVKRGGFEGKQALNEAEIDYSSGWNHKHLLNIEHNYKKSPHFAVLFPSLTTFLETRHQTLADLTTGSIVWALGALFDLPESSTDLHTLNAALPQSGFRLKKIALMSKSGIPPADKETGSDANDWIVETCRKFGANEYHFGGTSAGAYMDFSRFEKAGIALVQQRWNGESYRQQFKGFLPNLSILDLLLNVPRDDARRILMTNE